jgi:serine/threonine-protein kinase
LLSNPIHVAMAFEGRPSRWPFGTRHFDVSRDGARIVVEASGRLWIRSLGSALPVSAQLLCTNPFFSPDAAWVGCFSEAAGLVKIAASGGGVVPVVRNSDRPAGAAWGSDGQIYFATSQGVFRVADTGGEPEMLIRPDPDRGERLLAWPELLPGGRALLLTVVAQSPDAPNRIVMLDLRTRGVSAVLTGGGSGRYAPTGHLIYSVGRVLKAVRFDPESGATRGEHVTLSNLDVALSPDNGAAEFAISANGTLAFLRPAAPAGSNVTLHWIDRNGGETPIPVPPGPYRYPRVSPDGKRLVLDMNPTGSNRDIWLVDLERAALSRFTTETSEENLPQWSLDGSRIYFNSNRSGDFDVYSRAADGSGEARLEVTGPGTQILENLTPDGRKLIALQDFATIVVGDLETHRFEPLLQGDAKYWVSNVSPDGRWIAYESNESGDKVEIYVRPYPDVRAGREKVSTDGGRYPLWGPAGSDRLFFLNLNGEMLEVQLQLTTAVRVGEVRKLFEWMKPPAGISGRTFDVSPIDGRFIVQRLAPDATMATTEISVVLNWFDELLRQVP